MLLTKKSRLCTSIQNILTSVAPKENIHTQQPPWSNKNGEVWTRPTCTSRSCPPSSKEFVVEAA